MLTELEKKVLELEEQYNTLMQGTAEAKARKDALEQRIANNTQRLETIQQRRVDAQKDLDAVQASQAADTPDFAGDVKALEERKSKTAQRSK